MGRAHCRGMPVWPASLALPGACLGSQKCCWDASVWEPKAVFPFQWEIRSYPQCKQRQPLLPHALICSSCSPVQWDSGCRVTQLFLATSITGMCALRAVFCSGNCCTWPWAEPVCPLATVDLQVQPAKLFLNRHQHHPQLLSMNTQARI